MCILNQLQTLITIISLQFSYICNVLGGYTLRLPYRTLRAIFISYSIVLWCVKMRESETGVRPELQAY